MRNSSRRLSSKDTSRPETIQTANGVSATTAGVPTPSGKTNFPPLASLTPSTSEDTILATSPTTASDGNPYLPVTNDPSKTPSGSTPALDTSKPSKDEPAATSQQRDPTSPRSLPEAQRRANWASCVMKFKTLVQTSPLIKSALAGVEAYKIHPIQAESGASGLQWTLASMLSLHVRAALSSPRGFQVTVPSILASLWLLQSLDNANNSLLSPLLSKYLEHLPAFDPVVGASFLKHWNDAFATLRGTIADAQLRLLTAMNWKIRPDFGREVVHCYVTLFVGESDGYRPSVEEAEMAASLLEMKALCAATTAKDGGLDGSGRTQWVVEWMNVCNSILGIAGASGQLRFSFEPTNNNNNSRKRQRIN